jgi:hypothetical protein
MTSHVGKTRDKCQMTVLITLVSWKWYHWPRQATTVLFSHSQMTRIFDLRDVTNSQIIISSVENSYTYIHGCPNLLKSKRHFKISGVKKVTWRKFHTENPQIFGAAVKNLVATCYGARDLCTCLYHILYGNKIIATFFTMKAVFNIAAQCIFL